MGNKMGNKKESKELLKEAIKKSGNNLHIKVVEELENNGWEEIDMSCYYCDDTNNIPREIDIKAVKSIPISQENPTMVSVCLFIECKHLKDPVGFRMREIEQNEIAEAIGIREYKKRDFLEFLERNKRECNFHYIDYSSVGCLYDVGQIKNGGESNENKHIFNAITQPIKSQIFFEERMGKGECTIHCPVTVYEGIDNIYKVNGQEIQETDNSSYEIMPFKIRYSYKKSEKEFKTKTFIIDFVHISSIKEYLDIIMHDLISLQQYALQEYNKEKWDERMDKVFNQNDYYGTY